MDERPPIARAETEAAAASYGPPVDRLLALGDPRQQPDPFDYPALGLGPEQVPELIRLAADPVLNWSDPESREVWAPLHAWRALGQLKAVEAVGPLLGLFEELDDSEWFNEDMPEVFGQIGPAAIPPLAAYLADPAHGLYPRTTAATSLEQIGKRHAETRDEVVGILARQLATNTEREADTDDAAALNGFLISSLIGLRATEAAPAIERAFATDRVDEMIAGDWDDVQVALRLKEPDPQKPHQLLSAGLITHDELLRRAMSQPPPRALADPSFNDPRASFEDEEGADGPRGLGELGDAQQGQSARRAKAKSKAKMAKQSRRKNRKRK